MAELEGHSKICTLCAPGWLACLPLFLKCVVGRPGGSLSPICYEATARAAVALRPLRVVVPSQAPVAVPFQCYSQLISCPVDCSRGGSVASVRFRTLGTCPNSR